MPTSSSPLSAHVVVIGAGIAGLAAAHALRAAQPGLAVTVLEADDRIGGKLRVGEVAGVAVDEGAEAMLQRRPEAVELAEAVGLGADLVVPATTAASIWTGGRFRQLPVTLLGVPADLGSLAHSGVLSARGLARAAAEPLRPREPVPDDVAIGPLVAARFGSQVRERLLEPLMGGVYAARADELSLRATVPALSSAVIAGQSLLRAAAATVRKSPPGPPFAGIAGGVGRLPGAAGVASGAEVQTRTTVRQLRRLPDDRWQLVTGPVPAPRALEADAVVLAVPAAAASRLLDDVAPSAAAELAGIAYASVAVITLAYPSAAFTQPLVGSGYLVSPSVGQLVKACTYSSAKWRWVRAAAGDTALLRCSVGRLGETSDLQRDDADLVSLTAKDLTRTAGVRGRPVDALVTRWGGALPQYAVGHVERVARIRSTVADVRGLAVCGAAYDGVGIPACIASARLAATSLLDQLRARETMRS